MVSSLLERLRASLFEDALNLLPSLTASAALCEALRCRGAHTPSLVHAWGEVFREPTQNGTLKTPGIL